MATKTWQGGEANPNQGQYETGTNWVGGAAPVSGDTASITGATDPGGIQELDGVTLFNTGNYTQVVMLQPVTGGPTVITSADQIPQGDTISGETIDFDGTAGAIQAELRKQTLSGDTINVVGHTVFTDDFTNAIDSTVNIGTPGGSGLLEFQLEPFSANVGGTGSIDRTTTTSGTITVGDGSQLLVNGLSSAGEPA